jgi:transposase
MTCTEKQLELLIRYSSEFTQEVAAAKAGMSISTAKRYLRNKGKRRKKRPEERTWRTRPDAFSLVWPEIRAMLERDPGLEAQTLMTFLIETHPTEFNMSQVRTMRRRVREWRVLEGPERKEIMFRQNIQPGRQSQSDYTHCNKLNITIAGEPFPHLLYHFMLPYSRWEYVWICFTESFETLTTGYGRAVRELGAVAGEHRTDNLAAAVPIGERHVFQTRWKDFLAHFGVQPSANNPGCSNENGSVEKSHDLFKHAIDQRLLLRGSRDFKSIEEYETFLVSATSERNRIRQERLIEEMKHLVKLPTEDWYEPKQHIVTVSGWSTFSIDGATYSIPSRFIGQQLRALVDKNTVRVYFGRHLTLEVERRSKGERCINYRHLIFHLLRKPGAFRNYQFREELFPRVIYRKAYDALLGHDDARADKEYLRILNHATMEGEDQVSAALDLLLESGMVPFSENVYQLCKTQKAVPEVHVLNPTLEGYDSLLSNKFGRES